MLVLNVLILTVIISTIILIKIIKSGKNKNDDNNFNDDLIYKNKEGIIFREKDIDNFIKIYVFYSTEHAPNFTLKDKKDNVIINFKGDYIDSNQNNIKNINDSVDFVFYTLDYYEVYSSKDGSLVIKYLLFKLYLKYNDYRYIVESKGYEGENFEVKVENEIDYNKRKYVDEINRNKRGYA